jgi:succinate-acetate transporter protein
MSGTGTNWANPVPAGLIALGLACLIFCALLNGIISPDGMGVVGIWLISGFFVQVIVGVIEIRLGSSAGGNTFLWFSAYFMLATGSVYLMEYVAHSLGWKVDPRIEGYCWVGITFVMWLLYPSFLKTMPLTVALLITIMNIGAPLITGLKLGVLPKTLAPFLGDAIGVAGLLGLYSAACVINNTVYGKAILPFPGPIIRS